MTGQLIDGIVDTLLGFPTDPEQLYATMRRQLLRDRESKESFAMPAEYMFHDVPAQEGTAGADPVAVTLREMDRCGVEVGLVSLSAAPEVARSALRQHPDRFVASYSVDPNRGMEGIRDLVRAARNGGCAPSPCSRTGSPRRWRSTRR